MDDDEIMGVLREALAPPGAAPRPDDPPATVLRAALAAGRWTDLDDELAVLAADSADPDSMALVGTRAADSELRLVTYLLDDLTIECELSPEVLLGQAVPVAGLSLELVSPDGASTPVELRPDGSFLVAPPPAGPVGIRCTRAGRPRAMTPWLLA